jgi:hypothetical protein
VRYTTQNKQDANMSTTSISTHPDYPILAPALEAVRTAALGGYFVKLAGYKYLPHPSQIDTTSPAALQRYTEYLAGAEFDEIPMQTLKSWLGRMKFNEAAIDLPSQLQYLIENADNDGVSLTGLIEQTASNVMQVGWHLLVAEYMNAPKAGESMSATEKSQRNVRAAIKSYNRESVLDWSFARVNGALQLNYLKLYECRSELNTDTGTRDTVNEYVVLALDEMGAYYWQRFDSEVVTQQTAERNYVTVGGKPLRWLPVDVVCDIEQPAGQMPKSLGLLSPIATACLHRYYRSAKYNEALDYICPTTYTSGWDDHKWEVYKLINGIDYIPIGNTAMVNLPDGVEMGVLNPSPALEAAEKFFDSSEAKIKALGGVWPSENGEAAKTATQSNNESSEVTSRLVTLANNLESAFRRMALYCGMFEGLWAQDAIEANLGAVVIDLPNDFASSKMSAQDQQQVRENYLAGLYGRTEALKILFAGGVTVSEVEVILAESESLV